MEEIKKQHFNKGKKRTPEQIKRLSDAHKGFVPSVETRKKLSIANKGRKLSPEHVLKISIAQRGVKCPGKGLKGHPKYGGFVKGDRHSEETKRKISEIQKGRPSPKKGKTYNFSPEVRKRMSDAGKGRPSWHKGIPGFFAGEKHWNWKGGKSKEKYFLFTPSLKKEVLVRDNNTCQICSRVWINGERRFDIHHIDYDKKNNSIINLITLCKPCHVKTNFDRLKWIMKFTEASACSI